MATLLDEATTRLRPGRPLCLFDLDRTLLTGRTIMHLGRVFGVIEDVERIWDAHHRDQELAAGREETEQIAALFEGVPLDRFEAACAEVPLRPEASAAVRGFRGLGFNIVVVSASYRVATRRARDALELDADVGVELAADGSTGTLTGRVVGEPIAGPCGQYICKEAVLVRLAEQSRAPFTVAVGDGKNDVCMIERADLGVALEPCAPRLRNAADAVVAGLDELVGVVKVAMDGAGKAA